MWHGGVDGGGSKGGGDGGVCAGTARAVAAIVYVGYGGGGEVCREEAAEGTAGKADYARGSATETAPFIRDPLSPPATIKHLTSS